MHNDQEECFIRSYLLIFLEYLRSSVMPLYAGFENSVKKKVVQGGDGAVDIFNFYYTVSIAHSVHVGSHTSCILSFSSVSSQTGRSQFDEQYLYN